MMSPLPGLVLASIVDADAGGGGAFVGAGPAAIELAVTHDALGGFHRALASGTGAFHGGLHLLILPRDRAAVKVRWANSAGRANLAAGETWRKPQLPDKALSNQAIVYQT